MKKVILCIFVLLFLAGMTGCSQKEIKITAEDISENTLLVKRNGAVQMAIVEDFDKPYYNYSELEEFVKKEVTAYNDKAGGKEITIDEIILKENKAIMLLSFSGMAHYSAFQNVAAAFFSANTENVTLELPDQYVSAKSGSKVDRATAMKDGKSKVLVVYEPYKIMVDGKIKYYSENGKYSEEDGSISSDEGTTVVIFKP